MLVVVAVSIVAIIAIMGLALDVGVMFIGNARLRRAVDSAALAAALQYRAGFHVEYLDNSATEFLRLNGINDPYARVLICITPVPDPIADPYLFSHYDPALCTVPPRKLVRVVATGTVALAFLPVINIDQVPIAADATSETASVDVVLVLDRSDSMTYTAPQAPYDPMRDPSVCNNPADPNFDTNDTYDSSYLGYCRPFDEVKKAAVSFVEQLYFPYDRVAVVTIDKNAFSVPIDVDSLGHDLYWSNDKDKIISKIKALKVYPGEGVYPNGLPSRYYDPVTGDYLGLGCPQMDPALQAYYPDYPSPAPCTTTNIGAGLNLAGREFNIEPVRQEALWVVILLTDGVANAGNTTDEVTHITTYFCPDGTWSYTNVPPKCNDGISATHHPYEPTNLNSQYDAEDYAYDAAEFVAHDQSALLFTIGLGSQVRTPSSVDHTFLGELFLKYAADHACDPGHPATICPGTYTFAPNGAALREVFRKIAENIATRLSH